MKTFSHSFIKMSNFSIKVGCIEGKCSLSFHIYILKYFYCHSFFSLLIPGFDLWDSCYRNCGSARILRKSVGRTFVWPIWPHYHRFAIEMTCSCPSMAYLCHIVEKVLSRSLFRRSSPSLDTCRPKILTLHLITDLHLKWPALLVRFQS